jgi:hypothetical protein
MVKNLYLDTQSGRVHPDRRTSPDRRVRASLWDTIASPYHRRRSKGRRRTDRGAYIDIYDARTWLVALAVLILSTIDALMTGLHMANGTATELNPIMDEFIHHGGLPVFYGAKAAMTVIPLVIIFVHKEWTLGKFAARVCLWAYALLCCYHIFLALALN